jgi:hypothetical protein
VAAILPASLNNNQADKQTKELMQVFPLTSENKDENRNKKCIEDFGFKDKIKVKLSL